jgi:NAD(P)-dependent dehydrogenase (short-subunit alcohol dehydrogenase family)
MANELRPNQLRFDGKVVVVTGAGRNLGREYALLLARRGARVVVNDLGVAISDTDDVGSEPASDPAADVVAEIVAAGGEAVPNRDTVATPEGGEAIVEAALDEWGRVDVVVNNAGQVRMGAFADFPEAHVDTLLATQLRGVLNVSRPAWRAMASGGGGRFVNVSSGSAWGLAGGAVYGMAKMGVIGLTRAMAAEGKDAGIVANVIAPYAKTRPGTGMGPIPWSDALGEWLAPRKVAPLVGWLAHESCSVTGECFSAGAGHVAKVSLVMTEGFIDREPTIESIAAHTGEILEGPTSPVTPFGSRAFARMFEGYAP